jgi:hypothetical protein
MGGDGLFTAPQNEEAITPAAVAVPKYRILTDYVRFPALISGFIKNHCNSMGSCSNCEPYLAAPPTSESLDAATRSVS